MERALAKYFYQRHTLHCISELILNTESIDSGACYIDAHIPNYRELGIPGKTIALFSGNGFYRVYSKDGRELKSSEWLLWQRDYPDLKGASWVNGHVFYSTADGYGSWSLPECG